MLASISHDVGDDRLAFIFVIESFIFGGQGQKRHGISLEYRVKVVEGITIELSGGANQEALGILGKIDITMAREYGIKMRFMLIII